MGKEELGKAWEEINKGREEPDWMMMTEKAAAQFFEECIRKLELKEGDVLLVNAKMVGVKDLVWQGWPVGVRVPIIPLIVGEGQSLEDAVKVMPKKLLRKWLGE